jgi:RHS repeat-associated protein
MSTPHASRRGKTYHPSENRVGVSEAKTYSCTQEIWSITQCSRPEIELTPTTIASGVHYYGYRYYLAELGRWISRDPIGRSGGLNVFGYVANSPLGQFDVFGLHPYKKGAFTRRPWTPHARTGAATGGDMGTLFVAYQQTPWIYLLSVPAANFSYHYFGGGGVPKTVDFGSVIEWDKRHSLKADIVKDAADALRFADKMTADGPMRSLLWNTGKATRKRWGLAIGKLLWVGDGNVSFMGSCVELKLKYHLWDPYDFAANSPDKIGVLTDGDYRRLHEVYLADEFLVTGETAEILITWTKGNPPVPTRRQFDFKMGNILRF